MTARRPNMIRVLREVIAGELALIHTGIAGKIQSYDAQNQTATVQISTRFSRANADTGERETYVPTPLPNVPILWPSGGGGEYSDTWPLSRGDEVWLMFAERSIDEWVLTGEDEVTPADPRRFHLSDALATPAKSSRATPLPSSAQSPDARVIRAPEIRLGSAAASDFVALASLVKEELDALWDAFSNHTHGAGTLALPGSPPVPIEGITGTGPSGSAGDVAAGKVKAE